MAAGTDELFGDGQRIDEAAAHRLHVEGGGTRIAEPPLQQAGDAREDVVGRRGGDDDQVERVGIDPGSLERALAGCEGQVAARRRRVGEVAGTDAGARDDPLVAGVDATGHQIVVADRLPGQVAADTGDACKHQTVSR